MLLKSCGPAPDKLGCKACPTCSSAKRLCTHASALPDFACGLLLFPLAGALVLIVDSSTLPLEFACPLTT